MENWPGRDGITSQCGKGGLLQMVLQQLAVYIENQIKSLPHATHTNQIQEDLEAMCKAIL